ncbi:hypothetical protein KM868_11850 [Micrococcus luteus]|uniref:hypothetical protein n=1 Tax=Micrococcus luteus TaxID=1270 RepID=UPI001C219FFA|nr:hypothetical protein [Micrococcus luteus]MBU8764185.1 hypothetical protein [Micrococcus luteus]
MDHAIDRVTTFYELALQRLYDEWVTGKYKKLSDCPVFEECRTYRKAIKVMRDWAYKQTSRGSVKEDLKGHMWVTKGIEIKW